MEQWVIGAACHCEGGLPTAAIQLEFQMDCFVAALLATTVKEEFSVGCAGARWTTADAWIPAVLNNRFGLGWMRFAAIHCRHRIRHACAHYSSQLQLDSSDGILSRPGSKYPRARYKWSNRAVPGVSPAKVYLERRRARPLSHRVRRSIQVHWPRGRN